MKPWALEQLIGVVIYSCLLPLLIRFVGFKHQAPVSALAQVLAVVILMQVLMSFIFIYAYDRNGTDMFKIELMKRWFRSRFKQRSDHTDRPAYGKALLFALYTYKVTPPVVLLLMRDEGRKGHAVKEMTLVSTSILIATAYSCGLALGLLWAKWLFLSFVLLALIYLVRSNR